MCVSVNSLKVVSRFVVSSSYPAVQLNQIHQACGNERGLRAMVVQADLAWGCDVGRSASRVILCDTRVIMCDTRVIMCDSAGIMCDST
jgi:hypothetical protein